MMTGGYAESVNKTNPHSCNLILGWDHWPPFQYLNEKKQPKGYQIELVKRIAALAGCKIDFILQTFEQNQQSIREGKIDLTLDITKN